MTVARPSLAAEPAKLSQASALLLQRKCDCGTHTPGGAACVTCADKGSGIQRKLAIGRTDDPLEAEADRMADAALRHGVGGDALPVLRRSPSPEGGASSVPESVARTLAAPGAPLERHLRRDMEDRFGHDFSGVRVHSDEVAARSAEDVNARAYTVGQHIVFARNAHAPGVADGRRLLAHELAHVVQQNDQATLRRKAPSIGTKFTHPAGTKSKFSAVSASFDGQDFVVNDGSTTILSHAAQSGKPVSVRANDARRCKGSSGDSYLNNSRYVGIKDFGAIPEGSFVLNLANFATFSALEQANMITGGNFIDPFGSGLHGGDWGSGRAPLKAKKLLPASCGNTAARSGFFLHGGSLPGSSGCIDIDNDGIDDLLKNLAGYKSDIEITVRYTKSAPSVGSGTRALGRFTYPTKNGKPIKDPSISDRLGALLGDDDEPKVATPKSPAKEESGPSSAPAPDKQPKKPTKKQDKKAPKKKKSAGLQAPLESLLALIEDDIDADDQDLVLLYDLAPELEEEA